MRDAETPAANLLLTKTSNNNTLLPASRITIGGTGTNRFATLAPMPNQYGTARVTITLADASLSASSTFTLTVTPSANRPAIVLDRSLRS